MHERYQGGNREAERQFVDKQVIAEKGRQLSERKENLEAQINTGERTDPDHLDDYLLAAVQHYQWQTLHPKPWRQQETDEELLAKYTRVEKGNLVEKAIFCIDEANSHEELANSELSEIIIDEESQNIIQQEQQFADNWRLTAINRLSTPD